jgi:lipoate-protein ligase A
MPSLVGGPTVSDRWRLLEQSYGSVFQNLAIEEALARSALSPTFRPTIRLWVNPQSVILGRFQKASIEVDTSLCQQSGIQIARRFTGGGAVYQDEGNLNLTLVIQQGERHTQPRLIETASAIVLDALLSFGLKGNFLAPNSIMLGERKISGGAAAYGYGFTLWHGSLLVSTNIDTLESVLAPSRQKHTTHYVRSRWHPVTTLEAAVGRKVSVEEVQSKLTESAQEILGAKLEADGLRADEKKWFTSLYTRKYSLPNWNNNGEYEEFEESSN